MMRFLRSLWIWASTALLVLMWVPLLLVIRLSDRNPLRLRTARWFRKLGRITAAMNPAWRVRITGSRQISRDQVYVVVSNHQSLADIPLIAHLDVDAKWLAKAELFKVPVFGWMMKLAGDIPVERSDRRKAAQALLQCARYLKQRCSVVFFPEGTRSATGEVLPFNDGPFQLAIREKIPVLPLVVEGTRTALPKSTWLFGPPQDVLLDVLPPLTTESSHFESVAKLREAVRTAIMDRLEKLRDQSAVPNRLPLRAE